MAENADTASAVALDPSAPAAERYDAQVEIHKSGLGDLIPRSDLQPVIDYINESFQEQAFSKALARNVIPFPPKNRGQPGVQSVVLDDFQIAAQGEYWDRPGVLGFDSMRAMVEQTPILNSIVLMRIRQISRFCSVQTGGVGPGFVIEHRDQTVELSDEQRQSVNLLQEFMLNCGWETDPRKRKRLRRDTFSQFMAKHVRDSLVLDSAPIETEFKRDRELGLDGFYAIDGATIRLCTEEGYEGDDEIFALQVLQGRIRTAYTYDDLIYEVRNPRSDVTANGYGYSETEMLIRIVTHLLNAMTYNGSYFDKNSIPKGILHLSGNYSPEDIAAFKRYWAAMVKGIQNTWNMPIMISKDQESKAGFESVGPQMNEMAFAKWLTFLTSIACAIYGTSPEEIAMESFAASKSSLSGSDTEERLANGTDKGLRPLLAYIENWANDFVIRTFSDQYRLRFKGLDDADPEARAQARQQVMTWNEGRQEQGFDPIEGDIGDAPLNPTLVTVWQAERQQAQQPAEDFGRPGEGGDSGGDEPPPADDHQQGQGVGEPEPQSDFGRPEAKTDDFGRPQGDGADLAKAFGMPDLNIYRIDP